jgi:hypothetical protein
VVSEEPVGEVRVKAVEGQKGEGRRDEGQAGTRGEQQGADDDEQDEGHGVTGAMVRGATGSVRIGPSLASRGRSLLAGEATIGVQSDSTYFRRELTDWR